MQEAMQGIVTHLWQSTAFGAMAALLILALRRTEARTRYWIWLVASLKFVVPFAPLIAAGRRFAWVQSGPVLLTQWMVVLGSGGRSTVSTQQTPSFGPWMAVVLTALWAIGMGLIVWSWWRKSRTVRGIARASIPVRSGREFDALRRAQARVGRIPRHELRRCPTLLEPGVFGILRPLLLLPDGISECLEEEQLDAILSHELCHIRRHDNLFAALQMAVAAIFWFHPLVWWLGAQMDGERERACDDEVLRLGSRPENYAEAILRVCRFYLELPLPCVCGITGADLRRRIEGILTHNAPRRAGLGTKILLAIAASAAVAGPFAFGMINGQPHVRDERRVRLMVEPGGRLTASNITLKGLVGFAYHVSDSQIAGGPDWIDQEGFNLDAPTDATEGGMRTLLRDRFHLKVRLQTRVQPAASLSIAANGPQLENASDRGAHTFRVEPNALSARGVTMNDLAHVLSDRTGLPVADRTGLAGTYNLNLKWASGDPEPALRAALRDQLGLALTVQRRPVEIVLVDHAERPRIL